MRTRSSSNLPVVSPNPSTSNPKRRNRRRSKKPFILKESPIDTMADQRTMTELLRAPAEGYAEAIVVPPILAEQFELKHSLINMMTSDQFFRLEKDNPHDHIRWFNKITSTIKYKDVSNSANKLMLFPFSLAGAARRWLEKEPPWSGSLSSKTVANPKGELKAITTRSGLVLDGPTVPTPPPFINPKEDECVEETLTDPDLSEYTIKVPPPPLHINITLVDALILMPKYQKMLKALLSNKEKLQELASTPSNENCSAVILKKLPEKFGDPRKFLIPCGFSELKCKALADLAGIARDVFVSVGKFEFLADFVIVDYESDPRVPFILGRPFLRTARTLIDVHSEEMILRDGDERLTLNMRHETSSYSNQPQKESTNLINVFNDSSEIFLEDLFSTNQPSGNPTFSSHPKLTSSEVQNDIFDPEGGNVLPEKLLDLDSTKDLHSPLHFDVEFDLKEIEFLLHQDIDSSIKDSVDQSNLANPADNFVDSMPEMFTDEHALDYSSPSIFDEYDDDFLEVKSDAKNIYDDPLDSKGEKIKESKLLIDELDLPCDFLPPSEYDSFIY
nr:hypothetical protein [Tanacetum cinerariifolium]